jgi:hypothetical protein
MWDKIKGVIWERIEEQLGNFGNLMGTLMGTH